MKKLLKESLELFIKNFVSIIILYFPFLIIISFFDHISPNLTGVYSYISSLIHLIISSLFLPIFIIFLSRVLLRKEWSPRELVFRGIFYTPYILMVNLIFLGPVLLAMFIMFKFDNAIVSLLLAIIAITVAIKISFSNFLIVLENNRPIEAIKNSFSYTSDYIGKILLSAIIIGIPIGIIGGVINIINLEFFDSNSFIYLFASVITNILYLLIYIAFFKIYCLNYFQRIEVLNTSNKIVE